MKEKRTIWTDEEIQKLIELFPNTYNCEIAKQLNKSIKSIASKSHRLLLKKSKEHKSECISKRNKMVGRDITFEFAKQQALLYKTRSEFQLKDSSCYTISRVKGYLDKICLHMSKSAYSIPQLILRDIMDNMLNSVSFYNDRKTIKPYELDIYYPEFNLAFEYNGKGWHKENKNDSIKLELCNTKNITLIVINENNRKYESDIKEQLIHNLIKINQITSKKLSVEEIFNYKIKNVFETIYNKQELIELAKKYNSIKVFKSENVSEYNKILKLKILDECTAHMKDKKRVYTIESIKLTIFKYTNLSDLIKNDWATYQYVKRHGLSGLLSNLIKKRNHN